VVRGLLSVVVSSQWSVAGRRANFQTPNPRRQRNPKHQVPNHAAEVARWRFRFGAYLGFWVLGFGVFILCHPSLTRHVSRFYDSTVQRV